MSERTEAIAQADAYLNNAGLPTYSELMAAARELAEVVRKGPPAVIGYDHNGPSQKAFNHGWNAKSDLTWNALPYFLHPLWLEADAEEVDA